MDRPREQLLAAARGAFEERDGGRVYGASSQSDGPSDSLALPDYGLEAFRLADGVERRDAIGRRLDVLTSHRVRREAS